MNNNKLYMFLHETYHGDCDIPEIMGVWDNPKNLMGYFNELRKQEFDERMKEAESNQTLIPIDFDLFRTSYYHVVEFEPNIGYKFDMNELTYPKVRNEDTPFEFKTFSMVEFFNDQIFPKLWEPDIKLIEKHNLKINKLKAKEYTGKSLSKKMREFKSLLKDLKEHGVLEGEFFMLRRDKDDPLNKVNEGEDSSW